MDRPVGEGSVELALLSELKGCDEVAWPTGACDPDKDVFDELLLFVGASRAVMSLTIIVLPAVGDRLDIADRI